MAKSTQGGKRPNSGRKPIADKKVMLSCYPLSSRIETIGKERAQEVAVEAIENEYKKVIMKKS